MEHEITDEEIAKDVLHNEDHSKLTQEEIAKAVAHHQKKHKSDEQQSAQGQQRAKQVGKKPK